MHGYHYAKRTDILYISFFNYVTSWSSVERHKTYNHIIQKRALRIIFPDLDYAAALEKTGFETLEKSRDNICRNFFKKMTLPGSTLSDLLAKKEQTKHCLRRQKQFYLPKCRTSRFKSLFVLYSLFSFQWLWYKISITF